LAALIARAAPLSLAATCGIIAPVLQGLAAAHKAGIVHRDLKPENVFVCFPEGDAPMVKVIDFGISKVTVDAPSTRLTDTGQLLGTPAYMAPEQVEDAVTVDQRADIYSVGVMLYEMLAGEPPYRDKRSFKLISEVLKGEPAAPTTVNPSFPAEAEPIVLRAMAREIDERHASTLEVLDDLRELDAYAEREEGLAALAGGAFVGTGPQGTLGGLVGDSQDADAEAVLAEVVAEGSPAHRRSQPAAGAVASRWVVPAVLAIALATWLVTRSSSDTTPTSSPLPSARASAVASSASDVVQITVRGAPAGATISYDNAQVRENPFPARFGRAVVPLRVEAQGYTAWTESVVPDGDKVVEVALQPRPSSATSSSLEAESTPGIVPPPTPTTAASLPRGFRRDFE
jgi:serine/threonine-protein kinase